MGKCFSSSSGSGMSAQVSMVARNSRVRSEDPLAAHATARELAKEKPDAEERRPMYQGIPEHYS